MSENQKEEKVVTTNHPNQQNQDNQKKNGDNTQVPPVIHESKIPVEVPKQHNMEEQERAHKTPVAEQEEQEEGDEQNKEQEISTPVANEKQSNMQDAGK